MSQILKEGDFVELDYTGSIVEDDHVFDTTDEETAKNNNLHNPESKYKPVKICIGQKNVILGLDKNLVGKEIGKSYTFKISPEEGFGQKNPKLMKLIATDKIRQKGINPTPGLQIDLNGAFGTIRTVSGGRTVVDFNHPLSGKELEYKASPKRVITDTKEKIDATLSLIIPYVKAEVLDDKVTIRLGTEAPPENLKEEIKIAITELIPEIKNVSFQAGQQTDPEKQESNNKI